jgi:hypothetical protein
VFLTDDYLEKIPGDKRGFDQVGIACTDTNCVSRYETLFLQLARSGKERIGRLEE